MERGFPTGGICEEQIRSVPQRLFVGSVDGDFVAIDPSGMRTNKGAPL